MITPRFRLSQDENSLFVTIHAPFSRVSDAEIYMEGSDFRFHSNPYYLRLNLPGEVVENDHAKANFDSDTNEFKIVCPKVSKGTHFKGLDMLSNLLNPKGKTAIESNGIEVVDGSCSEETSDSDFDWFLEQKLDPESDEPLATLPKYGFAQHHSGLFSKLAEELHQVVDVRNPDNMSVAERRNERLLQEEREFNPEHYLADFFQTESIQPLITYKTRSKAQDEWTEMECNRLKNFSAKEFLMDHDQLQSVYLSLVDILLAYLYDMRTNMYDPTVESAWTIAKISGTLSWFEVFLNCSVSIYYFI